MTKQISRVSRALVLSVCFTWAATAAAGDPTQIIGKWIERFPNGSGLVTEFTATTISLFGVDASGKQAAPAQATKVRYRDLGDSIAVDFVGGGGILVLVKGPNKIILDFPGMGWHLLTRIPAPNPN